MTISSTQYLLNKIKAHISTVVMYTLFFALISVAITLLLPKEYVSTSKSLFKQNVNLNQDPYTLERAIDNQISILESLLFTDSTYRVLVDNNSLFKEEFNIEDIEKRRKAFQKDVKFIPEGGGFFSIFVYNEDPKKALEMNNVLNIVLDQVVKENISRDVNLQIVNIPFTKKGIARPNIILNVFAGMFAGLVFGVLHVALLKKEGEKHNLYDLNLPIFPKIKL